MTDFRPSTDSAAVVSDGFHWLPIDARTPRGCKLQLINRSAGVACYGVLGTEAHFWTHWAPLPTFAEPAQTCCEGGPQWGHAWGCKELP